MATPSFVQVPPDSTGKKLRTRIKTVGSDSVHEQAVFQTAPPTYIALADASAFAANKHHISILNDAGSGKLLHIQKMFLINVQASTVTGVMLRAEVKRATAHSGGTLITPQSMDSDNEAIPAEITVRNNASVTEGALLWPLGFNNDEIGATQAFPSTPLLAGINWMPEGNEIQSFRLREGEGLTIKQITSSTVGSFSYMIVFTMEDAV